MVFDLLVIYAYKYTHRRSVCQFNGDVDLHARSLYSVRLPFYPTQKINYAGGVGFPCRLL